MRSTTSQVRPDPALQLRGKELQLTRAPLSAGASFVAPSLADHHTHFASWSLSQQRIDLYTATSAAEVLERMRAWLPGARERQPDPAQFLVGQRMRVGEWPDLADMNRLALDGLEDARPLAIFFAGFHSLCANSPALVKLGIEPDGHDGVLEEADCFRAWTIINEVPEDVKDAAVAEAARTAACVLFLFSSRRWISRASSPASSPS